MKIDEPLGVVVASTPALPGKEQSAAGSTGDNSSVLAKSTHATGGMANADAKPPSRSGGDSTDPTAQPNIASPAVTLSAKANGSSGNQNGGKISNQQDGDIAGNVRSSSKEGEASNPVDNADGGNDGRSDEATATPVVQPAAPQTDSILGTVATSAPVVATVAVAATAPELSAPAASTVVASANASPLDTKIVQDRNRTSGSDLGSLPPTSAGVSVPGPAMVTKPKSTPSFSFGGTSSGVTFGDAAAAAAGSTGFSFADIPGVPAPSAPISGGVESTSVVQPALALGSARRIQANSPAKLAETKLVTGEEDEEELFRARCKLYVLEEGGMKWVERGVGHMKLNRRSKSDKRRLVMRTEATLRVILNTPVFEGFALDRATDRSVRFQGINLEDETNYCTFLARFSAKSDLDNLAACLSDSKE
jgi:RanBP1 domain